MTWIRSIDPEAATGRAAAAFAHLGERTGQPRVSHLWRVLGLDPRGVETLFDWRAALMEDPVPLSRSQAQAVALVVSAQAYL